MDKSSFIEIFNSKPYSVVDNCEVCKREKEIWSCAGGLIICKGCMTGCDFDGSETCEYGCGHQKVFEESVKDLF